MLLDAWGGFSPALRATAAETLFSRPAWIGAFLDAVEQKKVPLLDSDKGRKLHGELQRVGEETIVVAGDRLSCTHYQVTGDVQVDIWYDAHRRLVRQVSIDEGHKTVLELSKITNE